MKAPNLIIDENDSTFDNQNINNISPAKTDKTVSNIRDSDTKHKAKNDGESPLLLAPFSINRLDENEIDNLNVTGVTTTQTLHVGTGGTTLTVDADAATFAIGSATTTVTATMNGGAIPSIGLVIALGG